MDGIPKNSRDARAALDAVRRLVQALRISARAAESRFGLSAAQLFVLQKLREDDGASLGEVAEKTRTDQSSVSVVVQRLIERGLVSRRRDAKDARRVALSLTAKGKALARKSPRTASEELGAALSTLPARDQAALARILNRVVGAMGLEGQPAPMLFDEPGDEKREDKKRR